MKCSIKSYPKCSSEKSYEAGDTQLEVIRKQMSLKLLDFLDSLMRKENKEGLRTNVEGIPAFNVWEDEG